MIRWIARDRCLRNRPDQLDSRLSRHSPAGFPDRVREIESVRRHIIQEQLKLPDAWWFPIRIETMSALRLNRTNQKWEVHWRGIEKETT